MMYSILKKLHTDFSVYEENKLSGRSYFIPFSSVENLKKQIPKKEHKISVQPLNSLKISFMLSAESLTI